MKRRYFAPLYKMRVYCKPMESLYYDIILSSYPKHEQRGISGTALGC